MKSLKILDTIGLVLLIIGGLNWGLVGFFDWNLVTAIFGDMTILSRIVYVLVGFAAIWEIVRISVHLHAVRPRHEVAHA